MKTPKQKTPLAAEINRRITRSAARELERTLTPKVSSTKTESLDCLDPNDGTSHPKPINYGLSPRTGSPVPVKRERLSLSQPELSQISKSDIKETSNGKPASSPVHSAGGKTSVTQVVESKKSGASKTRLSSVARLTQPAHSGTPFKGKNSPLKVLRARSQSAGKQTHGQTSRLQQPVKANSSSKVKHSPKALRARSCSQNRAESQQARVDSTLHRRSCSQPKSSTTGVSPALSRYSIFSCWFYSAFIAWTDECFYHLAWKIVALLQVAADWNDQIIQNEYESNKKYSFDLYSIVDLNNLAITTNDKCWAHCNIIYLAIATNGNCFSIM